MKYEMAYFRHQIDFKMYRTTLRIREKETLNRFINCENSCVKTSIYTVLSFNNIPRLHINTCFADRRNE